MLERLLEQKPALLQYIVNNDCTEITKDQWNAIEKVVGILRPFEPTTKAISSDDLTAANVIPLIIALRRLLEQNANTAGIGTMKAEFLKGIKDILGTAHLEPPYAIATAVDPRFRLKLFAADQAPVVHGWVIDAARATEPSPTSSAVQAPSLTDETHPPAKRARVDIDPLGYLDDILSCDATVSQHKTFQVQVAEFLVSPTMPRNSAPLEWWK